MTLIDQERLHAKAAGLVYVSDEMPGISRLRAGTGFCYRDASGARIINAEVLARIKSLAVPPAYCDVWICPRPNGHIQATGRDDRGRKQYRYHPNWRLVRDGNKFDHMLEFARQLPRIRDRIASEMAAPGVGRSKVLPTVVSLLDRTLIRVGNSEYAKTNKSYGLTTLNSRHVMAARDGLRFQFKGKSGKTWMLDVKDRRIARVVRSIQELPGQALFQYVGDDNLIHAVESADVNAYLPEISGVDITSKDFRTWAGTVLAAHALAALGSFESQKAMKSNIRRAVEAVSQRLRNTPAVCRKSYIHPEIIVAYEESKLPPEIGLENDEIAVPTSLREQTVLAFLESRFESN